MMTTLVLTPEIKAQQEVVNSLRAAYHSGQAELLRMLNEMAPFSPEELVEVQMFKRRANELEWVPAKVTSVRVDTSGWVRYRVVVKLKSGEWGHVEKRPQGIRKLGSIGEDGDGAA